MELFNVTNNTANDTGNSFDADTLSYTSGYMAIVADPGVGKTTYAVWAMRQLMNKGLIKSFVYVDFDSKDFYTMEAMSRQAAKEGWYHLKALDATVMKALPTSKDVLEYALEHVPDNSGVILDTWNKVHVEEDNNTKGSMLATMIKQKAVSKNLLVTILGHFGKKKEAGLRGGSSIIGDVGYVVHLEHNSDNKIRFSIKKDSLGKASKSIERELTVDYCSDLITDVNINIAEKVTEVEKVLTNMEMKELKLNQQRKFLTSYVAAYLSQDDFKKASITTIKDFVLRNINRLEDGTKKSQDDEEYVPTKLIREEFANLMDTTFKPVTVKVEGTKRPLKMLYKISSQEFLREHKFIEKLPTIYSKVLV
jgi:hypothetical protein